MKTRKIETKVWARDDWFPNLSIEAKLMFIYLFTNEHIGVSGIFEISDRSIAFETGLTVGQVSKIKQELSPKVIFYKNYVYVKNAEKHDPIRGEGNTLLKVKERELNCLPQDVKDFFLSSPINPPSMEDSPPIDGRIGIGIGNIKGESAERGKLENSINFLKNLPDEFIIQCHQDYNCTSKEVIEIAQKMKLWCESKGKSYKNYRAAVQKWLFEKYGKRPVVKVQSAVAKKEEPVSSLEMIQKYKEQAKALIAKTAMAIIFVALIGYAPVVKAEKVHITYTVKSHYAKVSPTTQPTRVTATRTPSPTLKKTKSSGGSFWEQIRERAEVLAHKYDYPKEVLLGMMALETGHGTSNFAINRYNFCGLNAVDSNPDLANSFDSIDDGIEACIRVIKFNKRYEEAYKQRKNPVKMVQLIREAGYATDPAYVTKVISTPEFQEYFNN